MLIAVAALLLSSRQSPATSEKTLAPSVSEFRSDPGILLFLFLTGLSSMGMELVWVRQFTPFLGNVVYAFAGILGVYLTSTFRGSVALPAVESWRQ